MRGARLVYLALVAACGDNNPTNQPPEVANFDLTTTEDLPVMVTVAATDPEGQPLTLEVGDAPAHGAVLISGLTLTYTPSDDYNGSDTFSLSVTDGIAEQIAAVAVTVTALNDDPVGGADSIAVQEDTARVVTLASLLQNDTDVDGDTLTITAIAGFEHGSAAITGSSITFTPEANFNGVGAFTYTLSDGTTSTEVAVSAVIGTANDAPVAVDDTGATNEEVAVVLTDLLADDTDADGNPLSITAVTNAANGTAVLNGNNVTFTPAVNFVGNATFDYTVSDGIATDTGRVTIAVANVNDAPVAVADSGNTAEDTAVTFSALLNNDSDVDSSISITAVGNATNGSVVLNGGTPIFTPAANFNGTATFEYTTSDGALTDVGLVTITVTPVNDAPVAVDDTGTTAEDTAVTFANLRTNDTDIDSGTLTVTAVGSATNGTVILNGGSPRFTPTANFSGTATFQYTVSDGSLDDVGLVTITVTPVNDPPIASNDVAAVQAGSSVNIPHATLLGNDSDGGDGGALTITAVSNASNGSVALNAATVTFTPDTGFVGTASFDYTVSDGGATDIGSVTVTVSSGAICGDSTIDAPETCDDGNSEADDGCSAACTIETGFACNGTPSTCTPICNDGIQLEGEACDDGNPNNNDGCTTQCVVAQICDATAFPGGDQFVVDPATGHCYVEFDTEQTTFAGAQQACVAAGGYLATITGQPEQDLVTGIVTLNPWIGGAEDANDTDAVFDWVTDEAFGFTSFAPLEPDDDVLVGGNGDCLHIIDDTGDWADTNCTIDTFVIGRICEFEPDSCGDSIRQTTQGEECDDSNNLDGDSCSGTCQLEDGCGDGELDAGEECDDDNVIDGDTCSSTCILLEGCGDGNVDAGEQCDDDNTASGDGCSSTCQTEAPVTCGNGALDAGETCDDGNTTAFDGCSDTCQAESGAICTTTCSKLVINEIDYDNINTDTAEFVEIMNVGTAAASLSTIAVVFVNGSNNLQYARVDLASASSLAPGQLLVVANAAFVVLAPALKVVNPTNNDAIQNGAPDAVGIVNVATAQLLDALSYEGSITAGVVTGVGTFNFVEGTANPLADSNTVNVSLQRVPNGRDTNNATADFVLAAPTPGAENF